MVTQHPLFSYAKKVESTHKGLGNLTSFLALANHAAKCVIVVGEHGSGKTTACDAIAASMNQDKVIESDSITRSGLKKLEDRLNDFGGLLYVNDLGNIDTSYSVKESVKVLSILTHEHSLSKLNAMMDLRIENFHGSALTTIQPVAMRGIIEGNDWEAVIQDKTIRYYHLQKPTKALLEPVPVAPQPKIPLEEITIEKKWRDVAAEITKRRITQWSDSRSEQHITDMYKSAAAFRGGKKVLLTDLETVDKLMMPLYLENYFIDKHDLGAKWQFQHYDFVVLSELATWGKINMMRMARNYKVSMRTIQRVLKETKAWHMPDFGPEGGARPSAEALEVLKKCQGIM